MFPKYTVTLATYFDKTVDENKNEVYKIVRSTIAVLKIPEDTIITIQEFDEAQLNSENLIEKTYEVAKNYDNSKVIIADTPFALTKQGDSYETVITNTKELINTGFGTILNVTSKINRNDPCLCGSGKKFKKCCIEKPEVRQKIHYV